MNEPKEPTESQWIWISTFAQKLKGLTPEQQQVEMGNQSPEVADLMPYVAKYRDLPMELDRDRSGEQVGDFILDKRIGAGGMGVVYLAKEISQLHSGRNVAVKLIRWPPTLSPQETEERVSRFKAEVEKLSMHKTAYVVNLFKADIYKHDSGEIVPYLAMQYIPESRSLRDYVKEVELEPAEILRLMTKVCRGIQHIHDLDIIHGDLKPENILVGSEGEPRVTDFGLAKMVGDAVPRAQDGMGEGTPAYMSPEQFTDAYGESTKKSDVYALGVILYELLANKLPYEMPVDGSPDERLNEIRQRILEEEPTPLNSIKRLYNGQVEAILHKALAKSPKNRFASVEALKIAIERALRQTDDAIRISEEQRLFESKVSKAGSGKHPDLIIPSMNLSNARGVRRFDFSAGMTDFRGRDREIDDIRSFLRPISDCTSDFRWWLWTGTAGNGKSRLADQACQEAMSNGFEAGFLGPESIDDVESWDLSRPLLLVIDNASHHVERLKRLLRWGAQLARERTRPSVVRVLLIERSADRSIDSWLDRLLEFGYREGELADLFHSGKPVSPYELRNVDEEDLWQMMNDVWTELEFSPPDKQTVMNAFLEAAIPKRPLFAMLAAAAISDTRSIAGIKKWNVETLTTTILTDEVKRWVASGLTEEDINLVCLATICKDRTESIWRRISMVNSPIRPTDEARLRLIIGGESLNQADGVCAIRPDILGELLVRERLLGHLGRGNFATAEATTGVFQLAVKCFPEHTIRFLRQMLESLPGADTQKAVARAMKQAILPRPNRQNDVANAWHQMAHVYELLDDDKEALQCLNSAVEAQSKTGAMSARYCRGKFLQRHDEFARALQDFREYGLSKVSKAEWRASALFLAGQSSERLGDSKTALELYGRAVKKTGSNWHDRTRAAAALYKICASEGDKTGAQKALLWLTRCAKCSDTEAATWSFVRLTKLRFDEGDYSEAINLAHAGLRVASSSNRLPLQYWRGRTYFATDQYQEAIADFEKVIKNASEADFDYAIWAWFFKGDLLNRSGDKVGAVDCWNYVLIRSESQCAKAWAYLRIARACRDAGNFPEALEYSNLGIGLKTDDTKVRAAMLSERAHTLLESGDHSAATTAFGELFEHFPTHDKGEKWWALFYKGDALMQNGQPTAALDAWSKLAGEKEADTQVRAWAYYRVATDRRQSGDPQGSVFETNSGLALASGRIRTLLLYERASALRMAGEFEKAAAAYKEVFESVSENDPDTKWWALFYQGESLMEIRNVDDAVKCWTAASAPEATIDARAWSIHRLATLAYRNERDEEVVAMTTGLLRDIAVETRLKRYLLYFLALAQKRKGIYASATESLLSLLAVTPESNTDYWGTWARIYLAECLVAMDNENEAQLYLTSVVTSSDLTDAQQAAQDRLDELTSSQTKRESH
jgi:serine/threonine protein kinase/tetratricopeptide (TPR) repeat protein